MFQAVCFCFVSLGSSSVSGKLSSSVIYGKYRYAANFIRLLLDKLTAKMPFPALQTLPSSQISSKSKFFTALGNLTALLIFLQPGHIES